MNKCEKHHCWHSMPFVLTSYPPQNVRVCCNCGVKETVRHEVRQSFEGHGIYHPFNEIIEKNVGS